MTTFIGILGEFNELSEDWPTYVERAETFFEANGIAVEKHAVSLLTCIGGKTYTLLKNLVSPAKPSDKSFEEIVKTLKDHLSPKPIVIAERFRFYKRDQKVSESVNNYVAELKKLSQYCEFGATLNDSLRDRFVCGLRMENVQRRLLTEGRLTFNKAVDTAVAMETAAREATELHSSGKGESVHKLSFKRKQFPKCVHCGKNNHASEKCFHVKAKCMKCGKSGHISTVCRSRPNPVKGKAKQINTVNYDSTDSDNEVPISVLASVDSVSRNRTSPIYVHPVIHGKDFRMELDTGAAISVISKRDYDKHFSDMKIHKSDIVFKTYTGELFSPIGSIFVDVELNGQSCSKLELSIVNRSGAPLFGRNWLSKIKLDWNSIKELSVDRLLPTEPSHKLEDILDKHSSVFSEKLGTLVGIRAKLSLDKDATPKFCKVRQVPYSLKPKVEAELKRMEESGIISKVTWSEWASPIVPVVKKNGTVRICGDFKVTINKHLKVDQYPMPRTEDIFTSVGGGEKFSKIDLRQAYLQMELDEDSRKFTTINTHLGLYQYNRLVFGVASAPAIWQRTMEQVLQGVPGVECLQDDMLISGKTDESHLKTVDAVLQRLEDYGLTANMEKCEFMKDKLSFCGHEVDKNGLHSTDDKCEAIKNAPVPKNVTQVRSFLGMVNYYHRFLPNIASVVHPLNRLLEKDAKWEWSSECDQAFQDAKDLVSSSRVLVYYDPKLPVRVATDASPYGLGAVLSHVLPDGTERPIQFASRSLSSAERNYSQIDKEALAIVWGVKKFYNYVYGRTFTLQTDHKPLLSIFNPHKEIPAMTAARLQRYAIFLSGLNYKIEYKTSIDNANADCLSRLPLLNSEDEESKKIDPVDLYHTEILESLPVTAATVRKETNRDPVLSHVRECVMSGWTPVARLDVPHYFSKKCELSVHQGCLLWGMRVVIPPKLRPQVLDLIHEGHSGVVKMKSLARSHVWWPGIDRDIENLAKQCAGCCASQRMPTVAPLHPWEWPSSPFQRVHVDFAGPVDGYMLLVLVDAHSKWPEVVCMKSTTAAKTVEVLRTIFARNGIPEQIITDNGPQFVSSEFATFVRKNGIKHKTSAPYHPATNGLAERFVQTLKQSLLSMREEKGTMQCKISKVLMSYRNAVHCTTGETPAKLFMNRQLRTRIDLLKPCSRKTVNDSQFDNMYQQSNKLRHFKCGQNVKVRDYRPGHDKWTSGVISNRTGPLSYHVEVGNDKSWRRHTDQIVSASQEVEKTDQSASASQEVENAMVRDVIVPDETVSVTTEQLDSECDIPVNLEPEIVSSPESDSVRRYPTRSRRAPDRLNL